MVVKMINCNLQVKKSLTNRDAIECAESILLRLVFFQSSFYVRCMLYKRLRVGEPFKDSRYASGGY